MFFILLKLTVRIFVGYLQTVIERKMRAEDEAYSLRCYSALSRLEKTDIVLKLPMYRK